jgi:hypothetical protein
MQPAARSIDSALIEATVEALRRHAPFDRIERKDLLWMVSRLSLVYFAPQAIVLVPEAGVPQHFFIVRQGIIAGLDPDVVTPRWRLSAGEVFPLGALLAKRAVTSVFRAEADTFCWRLSGGLRGFACAQPAVPRGLHAPRGELAGDLTQAAADRVRGERRARSAQPASGGTAAAPCRLRGKREPGRCAGPHARCAGGIDRGDP